MILVTVIGQILLGLPLVVFAYWYEREEALFRSIPAGSTAQHTMYRHAIFGLFFGLSFATLSLLFFPPLTQVIALLACIYVLIRALDNIEHDHNAPQLGKVQN
jgi:hypothetical protein